MAVSLDMFSLMRRKAKARGVRTASNTTCSPGLDPRGFIFGMSSSPSADSAGATHQTSSPSASALPLPSPPAKITSISDIVFSNATFDALLESRNAGDQ
ncbi:uncharacterized protein ARMOST_17501 [Armillaria ostoyae]|uniref:Uncharacterized protein n=1 Tax=Armillaria ostoyae TaxID=47428 RepID=A0A284RZ54_ARMOS|nr:uncharacterized protein ARMOST_17501 [Armillaria ostoyae]